MNLGKVHQILIASALGLAILFGARSAATYARGGPATELALAVAAAVAAITLGLYLRRFRRKLAEK